MSSSFADEGTPMISIDVVSLKSAERCSSFPWMDTPLTRYPAFTMMELAVDAVVVKVALELFADTSGTQ